jgi:hypothetical protein
MPPMLISQPTSLAPEEWLRVNLSGTAAAHGGPDLVVVSGYALYNDGTIKGHKENDHWPVDYVAELLVGPIWLRLADVSPTVHVAGYESQEADEADLMAYKVTRCTWEFPEVDPKKIRLIVSLSIAGGEQASITSLGYHFVARGMLAPDQDFKENT